MIPKRHGGLSVVPLTTYLGQLGYIGLYLGTLRSGWNLRWLLPQGVRNSRGGNLGPLACYSLPQLGSYREGGGTRCCLPCQTFGLARDCEGCHLWESGMGN
jgi:hypothetical protein